jgi:predicted DNA-binding protein (MmcQ/YjbR family)
MKWFQRVDDSGLSNADLKTYLRESHRLVALGLTKKLRGELGLD